MSNLKIRHFIWLAAAVCLSATQALTAQPRISADTGGTVTVGNSQDGSGARPVTVPITVRFRDDKDRRSEIEDIGDLTVLEDGDKQEILSIRAVGTSDPLYLGVLIQDDLAFGVGNEIKPLKEFIERLPLGSRVMVGYIRAGSLNLRQRFTADLSQASGALRIPTGAASSAPFNPYVQILEALKRFDGQPKGRRALIVVSDGLDLAYGVENSSPGQSRDLQRAIDSAQQRGVAVYSIYSPTVLTANSGGSLLIANAQGSLNRLSDETGGRAYFQGTGAPVSFDPFLQDLKQTFSRQIALTFLSTHPKRGFHKLKIESGNQAIKIEHPNGYNKR